VSELSIDYEPPGPVAAAFLEDRSFVSGIMGPFGSGKTTAAIMKCMLCSARQPKDARGRRRSRGAIIRNTYPELKTTTIKSWHEWIPPEIGKWQTDGPPTHFVRGPDGLDAEVMFLALDRPEDVRKLLSLELTWAYINEAKEVPKAILDGLTGRVGRFPPMRDGGSVDPVIVMDTNPPDTDHWYYKAAEESLPQGWAFFRQPGGRSVDAENLHNLPPAYYTRQAAGKAPDWVRVYVDGEYGFVRDGKPVYPEFVDSTHCKAFELVPRLPLRIGLDFGLTPAAVIGQRKPMGAWRIRHEIVTERMGATALAEELTRFLGEFYPDREIWPIASITGDPAGAQGGNDDVSVFQILKANGVDAHPAGTNDFTVRREAVGQGFSRLIDGEPALLIHPECRILRKACGGGYAYARVQVQNQGERWQDKPIKNHFSHVAEALQYALMGGGEGARIRRTADVDKPKRKPVSRIRIGGPSGAGNWM
jgi:RecA/RadA recombinase